MRIISSFTVTLAVLLGLAIGSASGGEGVSQHLQWAQENYKAGRFADAIKNLKDVLAGEKEAEKPEARRFLARVYMVTGGYDEIVKLFAVKPSAEDLVMVGRAHVARGRYKQAEKILEQAFKDSKQKSTAARVELIDLWTITGRSDEAELARAWFFKNYKKTSRIRYGRVVDKSGKTQDVTDPVELVILARAMAPVDPQGAINALTVAQQKGKGSGGVEPYMRSFFLFLEKYAWGFAPGELRGAVKINKKHPEVLLGTAYYQWTRRKNAEAAEKALKTALEINPNMIPARVMMTHLHLFDDEYEKARKQLDAALAVNPQDLEALSTLAAFYYDTGDQKKFEETCAKILKINAKYAGLYNTIAGACERKRQFPQAHKFYKKAIELDPVGWRGYYGAGMALVRRGEDVEGKKLLEKAFKLNKYNLFCRNMLVVLDKLVPPEGYTGKFDSLKTEHFVIFAPKKDSAFLLPYYARCLEETYARLHKKYAFTPENPTVVEVFSNHSSFSARTTGLPQIGADGACFGKLITLDSARVWQAGTVPKFNWATVAEHELMHVFSLQLTNYRIPRWLTEGLSVYEEQVPRIELDRLFAGAARNNRLIKVAELNRQMTRPTARMNPLLAYYQARRIVEFIYAKHGFEGMKKLLDECKAGHKIETCIKNALGCTMEEFEKQVLAHQKKFAAEKVRVSGAADKATFTKLALEAKQNPEDPAKLAALASAYLQGRRPNYTSAAKYAKQAVAKAKPDEKSKGVARGYAVLGFIAFQKDKKFRKARELFEKAVNLDPGNVAANLYLGICAGKEGKSELALRHLLKAKELSPRNIGKFNAYEELYKVYRDLDEDKKALAVMRERVAVDKKGYEAAVRLGKLAIGAKDWKLAAWSAWQAVRVDPFKADPHLIWGQAAEGVKDFKIAEREWGLAVKADAANAEAKFGLARVLAAQGRKWDAKKIAEEAKALEPDHPDIKKFLKDLGPVKEPPPPPKKPLTEEEKKKRLRELLEPSQPAKDIGSKTKKVDEAFKKLEEQRKQKNRKFIEDMRKQREKPTEKKNVKTKDVSAPIKELEKLIEKPAKKKTKDAPPLKKLEKVDACLPAARRAA